MQPKSTNPSQKQTSSQPKKRAAAKQTQLDEQQFIIQRTDKPDLMFTGSRLGSDRSTWPELILFQTKSGKYVLAATEPTDEGETETTVHIFDNRDELFKSVGEQYGLYSSAVKGLFRVVGKVDTAFIDAVTQEI